MAFLLEEQNVVAYLNDRQLIHSTQTEPDEIQSKSCKNFNLLVQHQGDRPLLVKQEPHTPNGQTKGDLAHEWIIHTLMRHFPDLAEIHPLISEALDFDAPHSILVFRYLDDYSNLETFYTEQQIYPRKIAASLGHTLATLHQATFERKDYQTYLQSEDWETTPNFCQELNRLTPDDLGRLTTGAIKFYELYQRYRGIHRAIDQLAALYTPCCLVHNDLKLNNILLYQQWQHPGQNTPSVIRMIDWEKWLWGDPALDVGTVIASYLQIWLKSLVVNRDIDINLALRLAATPLEQLQPSIAAFMQAYLARFPELLQRFPDFLERVMQFTGLALIDRIQAHLHYYEPFGNTDICLFQVAKTLLCTPAQVIPTVFGMTAVELMQRNSAIDEDCSLVQSCVAESNHPLTQNTVVLHTSTSREIITPDHPLEDLVHHIQLHTDGTLIHPDYVPQKLPETLGDRFQDLSPSLQHTYLRRQLRDYLYDIYFSHEQEQPNKTQPRPYLKNDRIRGLDQTFYQQLCKSNQGNGYFDAGWVVQAQGQRGEWQVEKEGLTLQIQPRKHLQASPTLQQTPQLGDRVSVRLPSHRLEPGFYQAIGNAGTVPDTVATLEICFNVNPEGAVVLMHHFTNALNAIAIPFSFRVLLDPEEYRRYDAAILHIERASYGRIQAVLQQGLEAVQCSNGAASSLLQPPIPLLMKPLAPGVGLAEEPDTEPRDFGLHRCQRIADALWHCHLQGDDSPPARWAAIRQQFTQHGIDFDRPYLNPGSLHDYPPLAL